MKLSRASKLGLGTGVSAALLTALLADLPFAPAGMLQAAQGRVAVTSVTPTPTGVPTSAPTATGVPVTTPTPTGTGVPVATATPTATAISGGGSGSGGGPTAANGVTTLQLGVTTQSYVSGTPDPTTLTGAVTNITNVPVNGSTGATITDGNFAISIPPSAFASLGLTNVTIDIVVAPTTVTGLAGSVSASPNGTVVDIVVKDPSTGKVVTISPSALQLFVKPNDADIAMLQGTSVALRNVFQANTGGPDFSRLNAVYFVAPDTSPAFNPLGLPAGTALFVHNFKYDPATGLASWDTQNLAGIVQALVANPVSYVQTLNPNTQEWSTFDPNAPQQSFGTKPQFSYLQVVAPQIPVDNRLVVLDPDTGNYSYVNATDVAPSGPPPAHSSGALVRGLVKS